MLDAGLVRPSSGKQDLAEAVACLSFAGPVAAHAEQGQCLVIAAKGLLVAALPLVGDT